MPITKTEERFRAAKKRIDRFVHTRQVNLSAEVRAVDDDSLPPLKFGGWFEPLLKKYVRPAHEPAKVWHVTSEQYEVIRQWLSGDYTRMVTIGAKGSGKSEVLSIIAAIAALQFANGQIGMCAPLRDRREILWRKLLPRLHHSWIQNISNTDFEIQLVNGITFQFVALKEYSSRYGVPTQGKDWIHAFLDEEQDCESKAIGDVLQRLRANPEGKGILFTSCTLKETPNWRTRLARYKKRKSTKVNTLHALANVFVDPGHWERMKEELTPRQYQLEVLAIDGPPPKAVYPEFKRDTHLKKAPFGLARDVTADIVGKPFLLGHDPGSIVDVTLILKAFQLPGQQHHTWWLISEVNTDQSTAERHVLEVTKAMRQLGAKPSDCHVRADPYADNNPNRPHRSVYTAWQSQGYQILPARFAITQSKHSAKARPGVIHKEAGIDMVRGLLMKASGLTRLYFHIHDSGEPAAPRTVGSLEMQERDAAGKAETQRKDQYDLSHWSAALRYALWNFESKKS